MMGEVLRPGVEDGNESWKGAEMPRIGGEFEQSPGSALEEQGVETARLGEEQRAKRVWQREDDVDMGDWQDAGERAFHPLLAFSALAFGAMAVPTGVVGNALGARAGWADIDVPTQLSGATGLHSKENLSLMP